MHACGHTLVPDKKNHHPQQHHKWKSANDLAGQSLSNTCIHFYHQTQLQPCYQYEHSKTELTTDLHFITACGSVGLLYRTPGIDVRSCQRTQVKRWGPRDNEETPIVSARIFDC